MAGDKREVRVAVVGDAAQLQRELQKAEGHLSGFGTNAKRSGDILRTALFGGAVLYGAQKLVTAAANLEQSIGGTAAVFKQASGPINDFAKSAANLVGLSENAARTITSRLGASLQGFGLSADEAAEQAIFLTKTGSDLAATLGGTTDEAVNALAATLRGEFDPLERFGIALKASDIAAKAVSMGLAETTSSVSAYAKGQATLALLTERSAFAQGQFGREAGTASGQAQIASAKMEDASASLGKSLIPVYTKIQETIALSADAFAALPGPVQTGVVALTGIVLIGPKLVQGLSLAASAAKTAGTAILDMAAKAISTQGAVASMNISTSAASTGATAAAGGMALLGPAVLAVGAAAVVGGIAYKNYKDEQAAVEKDIKALIPTFNELTGAMTANTQTTLGAILASKNQIDNLNKAGISVAQFTDVIDDNRDALVNQGDVEDILRGGVRRGTEAFDERVQKIRDLGGTQNELIARLLETDAADMGLIDTLYNGIDAYNQQQEVIRQLNIQKGLSEGKSLDQATAEADLAAASKTASEALEKQLKVTTDLRDVQISEEEALIKNRKALQEYTTSLGNGSLTADERAQAELDLEKTYRASVQASVDAAEAQKALEGKTLTSGEAAAIQSQKFKELAGTLAPDSPLRKRLEDLSFQFFLLSLKQPEVKIRLETETAMAKFRTFLTDLGIPEGQAGLGEILSYSGNYVEPKAIGGPVNAGNPYLVGEKGPELFVPSSYGRIMNAFSTSKALLNNAGGGMGGGGSVTNVTINMPPGSNGAEVVNAIRRYEMTNGTSWRN
jgi:hypothetical protein